MLKMFTSIAVIGLGRIGLPTALIVAEKHETVSGVDKNVDYIASLNEGVLPFLEEGLKSRFEDTQLIFTTEFIAAELYIVAIPTLGLSGCFETILIEQTLKKIEAISPNSLVIIESTLPIGAVERLAEQFKGGLVYCPERVAPGSVFHELSTVPRCIASKNENALKKASTFYDSLGISTLVTSTKIAETVKLSENAFRDANIAFANRLSEICAENQTDVRQVVEIANTHPRVNILTPGLGAGGACLAPSTRTLDSGSLFGAIRSTNEGQIERVLKTLQHHRIRSVALWGISYKADCDDLRFSKAMDLKELLESNHIDVKIWDPVAKMGNFSESLNSDAIVFGVPHRAFKDENLPQKTRKASQIKYLIDIVHAIDIQVWNKEGFSCICAS